jgi:hypothetical protein
MIAQQCDDSSPGAALTMLEGPPCGGRTPQVAVSGAGSTARTAQRYLHREAELFSLPFTLQPL